MSSITRLRYHHGTLRETLLSASLQLIATEGIGAVSLRRVAREAGVSPAAPYHHFTDRAALLAALSAQGYQLLAEDMAKARSSAPTPLHALSALVRAYVTFAMREPAYFRLMFRPELSETGKDPETKTAEHAAARYLNQTVADCVRDGTVAGEQADTLAVMAWGLSHGLASLWLDGQLKETCDDPEALTTQITTLLESVLRNPCVLPRQAGFPAVPQRAAPGNAGNQ